MYVRDYTETENEENKKQLYEKIKTLIIELYGI